MTRLRLFPGSSPRASSIVAPRGITLTEILIAILIMGVGLISLATLFPLGLTRIRDAARQQRSAFLVESAASDLEARDLFDRNRFLTSRPLLTSPNLSYVGYDPFIQDTPVATAVYRGFGGYGDVNPARMPPIVGDGLPVVYDPLWRRFSGILPGQNTVTDPIPSDGRFAYGIGSLRNDPDGGPPSTYGLQRLTNFPCDDTSTANDDAIISRQYEAIENAFSSPDDFLYQSEGNGSQGAGFGSPLVPDMTSGSTVRDLSYSWMFTGQRADVSNVSIYVGDIVVFHNRPMTLDSVRRPITGDAQMLPGGERVVEAIFGYSSVVSSSANTPDTTPTVLDNELKWGYSLGSDRTVLLRWPNSTADPDVRIGSWIADVTYERTQLAETARFRPTATDPNGFSYKAVGGTPVYKLYPGQRCHWYRVVSKSTPRNGRSFTGDPQGVLFREMTLVIETPVKSKTILTSLAEPAHVNAALISSYVVQVVPRSFTSK